MEYFIYCLLLSSFAFLSVGSLNNNNKLVIYIYLVISLSLFFGIRYEVGSDYWNYYKQYIDVLDNGWDVLYEPGFILSVKISSFFVSSYYFYTLMFSFFSLTVLAYSLPKVTSLWLISFILIVISQIGNFTGSIRSAFVFGILVYSTVYIKEKKLLPFLAVIFIATSMHLASVIFIVSYWLSKIKLSKLLYILIFILSIILGISGAFSSVIEFIIGTLIERLGFSGSYINKLVSYTQSHLNGGMAISAIFKKSVLLIIFLFFFDKLKIKFPMYRSYFNIVFFGYIVYFLITPSYPVLGARISLWFTFFELIILPLPLIVINKNYKKYLFVFLILCISIGKLTQTILNYKDLYIPYKTYLGIILF